MDESLPPPENEVRSREDGFSLADVVYQRELRFQVILLPADQLHGLTYYFKSKYSLTHHIWIVALICN
jgi:hypothetical protein